MMSLPSSPYSWSGPAVPVSWSASEVPMKVSAKAALAATARRTASVTANTPARRRFTTVTTRNPRPGCGFGSGIQVCERVHEDLRERRERLNRVAQDVNVDLGADGEGGLLKPLAGFRSDRVRAY